MVSNLKESKVKVSKVPNIENYLSTVEDILNMKGFSRTASDVAPRTYYITTNSEVEKVIQVSRSGQFEYELWVFIKRMPMGGKISYVIAIDETDTYWTSMNLFDLERDLVEAIEELNGNRSREI